MSDTNPFGITREDVLNLAAQKLADEAASEEYVGDRVKQLIEVRVCEVVKAKLENKIEEVLSAQLERMLNQTVHPVNIFGDKVGPPTTIRDTLAERAKDFWNTKVDSAGKPAERDSYRHSQAPTRAEWMLGKMVSDQFAETVKQNAVGILAVFKERLREDGHAALDKHLDELIRVKSK